jgi:hypothetical protein
MVGDKIAKVECKECHSLHRYRDPKGKKKPAASPRKRTTRAKAAAAEPVLAEVEADMAKPVRDYRTTENFEPGERIAHVKLGEGAVQRPKVPGGREVLFGTELRTLAQAKPAPTLGPPPARRTVTPSADAD